MAAFLEAFQSLGYLPCVDDVEPGFEKVALYALAGVPKHAARQLANGRWTSKLGALDRGALGRLAEPAKTGP